MTSTVARTADSDVPQGDRRGLTLLIMARKPSNFSWGPGFTEEQRRLLEFIDHLGNNAWDRNGQTDAIMTKVLGQCEEEGLTIRQITRAMEDIGYSRQAVHQLERWESKRLTGRFGR